MQKRTDFTEGGIFAELVRFSLPVFAALFLQAMYGAVDLIIVGRFCDAGGVSAVAMGSQIMQSLTGIISGFRTGTMVCVAQYVGAKDGKRAGDTIGTTLIIFAAMAVLVTIVMSISVHRMVTYMNVPSQAYDATVQYVLICSCGTIFITAYNTISWIMRGIGNSVLPLVFVAVACVMNIFGDLFLVAVLGMGAAGAAMATVLSQAVSVLLSIIILRKIGLPFTFNRGNIYFNKQLCVHILSIGSPVALQDAMTSLSFLILLAIVNSLGLTASAAVGISEKICVFIMLIPITYMSSISAFVAQNIGAGKYKRAEATVWCGICLSLISGIIMFYVTFFHGEMLAGFFSTENTVINEAALYLKAYAIDCLLVCFVFCLMGFFNGCGKTVFVMAQGLIAAFLVRIPFAYVMSKVDGATTLFHIGLASPVASVLSVILCVSYYQRLHSKFAQLK